MNNNPSLADVILRRDLKIKERDQKREELARLDLALKELEELVEALMHFADVEGGATKGQSALLSLSAVEQPYVVEQSRGRRSIFGASSQPKTTKDLILSYLESTTSLWHMTEDVRLNISELKGVEVPMGTVGPTLSIMKKEGEIVRDGNKVALASRVLRE